ncbi:MAG: hypothetical protein NTW99_08715 [Chloroflexi bacterium]|nr:hypothetical protein [Chloroflexota bacterium]
MGVCIVRLTNKRKYYGTNFNFTGCGAALEYTGGPEHTLRCQYCGISMPVPEEFWREAEVKQTMSKWGKYLIIFRVITIGIPTCLWLVGTLLGVL